MNEFLLMRLLKNQKDSKVFAVLLTMLIVFMSIIYNTNAFTVYALDPVQKQAIQIKDNQSVHVVLLMDSSGSINGSYEDHPSDPEFISRDAAKEVVDFLPYDGNEIAIFEYSDKEKIKMVADLTPLNKSSQKELRGRLDSMRDSEGATHMIDAIKQARIFLEENHEEGVNDVIIVFTDGAESSGIINAKSSQKRIENEVSKALGDSNISVYSVAFDYLDENGNHSIFNPDDDQEGYGKKILDEFAEQSGGKVFVTDGDIIKINDDFFDAISSITRTDGERISVVKEDGKYRSEFTIDDSVVEADIRISCEDRSALKSGQMQLVDPNNNVIVLDENDETRDDIAYSVNLSAGIKITMPEIGKWALIVSDVITKEDIDVNLIQHTKISTETSFAVNGSVAYSNQLNIGDVLNVNTVLLSTGNPVKSPVLYRDKDTHASIFVSDKMDDLTDVGNEKEQLTKYFNNRSDEQIKMETDGQSFYADVSFERTGTYVIDIWINAKRFCFFERYIVSVGDNIDKILPEPKRTLVENGDSKNILDIDKYCTAVNAKKEIVSYDEDIISVEPHFNKNYFTVIGLKKGNTTVVVRYFRNGSDKYVDVEYEVEVINNPPTPSKDLDIVVVRVDEKLENTEFKDCFMDPEGDTLTFNVNCISDDTIANISFNDNTLIVEGLKEGKVDVEIEITDGFDPIIRNVIVEVQGKAPNIPLIVGFIALLLVLIIGLIILISNMRKRIHMNWRNVEVSEGIDFVSAIEEYYLTESFGKKRKVNLYKIIKNIRNRAECNGNARSIIDGWCKNRAFIAMAESITLKGGKSSRKPDILTGQHKNVQLSGLEKGAKIVRTIDSKRSYHEVELLFHFDEDNSVSFKFGYGNDDN